MQKRVVVVAVWLVFGAGAWLYASDGQGPKKGIIPLTENGQMQISPEDRCPVCGMKVLRYPKFSAAVQLQNDSTYYFCSTGCMVRAWLHPAIFLGKLPDERKRPMVREYFSGRQVDARTVIFVYGSDVIGPMGPAVVPVLDESHLKVFMNRHGGKSHFLLNEMNDNKWSEMTGRKIGQ